MRLLCPNCREKLERGDGRIEDTILSSASTPQSLACPQGHLFTFQDGVLQLLTNDFAAELGQFTAVLSQMRDAKKRRLLDPSVYPQLPFIKSAVASWEWRMRQYDLPAIQTISNHVELAAEGRKLQVLDVGAWNGWLSYRLTLMGCEVTAVDYFIDEYDGLAAKKHYPADWQAIQMDLTDLSVLDMLFDVVILNRCLQFAPDPYQLISQAQMRLSSGGCLIMTGLQFFADARQKAQQVHAYRQENQAEFGFELFLKPAKGYLDWNDKSRLESMGIKLRPYPQLWRANLKARLKKEAPWYAYGLDYK